MAITATTYSLMRQIVRQGNFARYGRANGLLEFGQANWYGDAQPSIIANDLDLAPEDEREGLANALRFTGDDLFKVANIAYRVLFGVGEVVSIDLDPNAPNALRYDLNEPLPLERQFDVFVNSGTIEHVYDTCQAFRSAHQWTKAGGLMIHESPYSGWNEHGFDAPQLTRYLDTAAANEYEIVKIAVQHLASSTAVVYKSRGEVLEACGRDQMPRHAMLFVAMRKGPDAPFKVPMQGVYAGTVSGQVTQAWGELR